MTTPSSAQHPESGTVRPGRKPRRPVNSAMIVALIAILAVAAIVGYVVIRWDSPQGIVETQVEPAEVGVVAVAPADLAIAPIEEAERFSPERLAGQAAVLAGAPEVAWPTYTDRYWALAEQSGVTFPTTASRYYAYYTERYWKWAEAHDHANVTPAVALPAAAADDYAYYTERYWKWAEAGTRANATLDEILPAAAQESYATYTDRYWRLAEASPALTTVPEPEWSYYEPSPALTTVPEPEWSYYTERYWALSKEKGD